ncbi:MAG: metalloregulator ArsR/SmtB family transcription factor, partial [Gemmatimonadota bacterium]
MNTLTPAVFDRLTTLGDATRSRLLSVLELHELSVTELCQVVQLPQSTVSRHLRILSDDGWVTSRAEGTSRYYRMEPELAQDASSLWDLVRRDLEEAAFGEGDRERLRSVLESRKERSRAFFEASAERWDALRDELYGPGAGRLPLFGLLEPEWVVADLGAGTGALARTLAPFVTRVVAVDRSPEMLRAARERTRELGSEGRVELREGDLESLPLEDGE